MAQVSNRCALITGLSGFTGRHLARRLNDDGWSVCGVGTGGADASEESRCFPNLDADLNETAAITRWISEHRPTHVVHLAAQSHVVGDPLRFYQDNLLGTESLLEAVAASGVNVQKILIASSANIYGNSEASPIAESAPYRPVNHYALSKVGVELLAQKWFARLPIIVTRPFNYTGPGQSEAFLFPKLVAAFHRRDAVIRLGNIDVARDLSDVAFLVEAYALLLRSPLHSEYFNICSGKSLSIRNAIGILAGLTGHQPEIAVDPTLVRADEITELRGDPARLQKAIGPLEPTPWPDLFAKMLSALDHAAT
jgi:GDP-6-deoxy-D-talose 4-dehydrogenase